MGERLVEVCRASTQFLWYGMVVRDNTVCLRLYQGRRNSLKIAPLAGGAQTPTLSCLLHAAAMRCIRSSCSLMDSAPMVKASSKSSPSAKFKASS